jgi:CDP-diacylglycerol--serine O-phosphatidyltransferase
MHTSALLLLAAAVADLLDGALARLMHAESAYGLQLDSLSDAITFGVVPAGIVLKSLSLVPMPMWQFFITGASMVFAICGVLRLARFNVNAQKSHDETLSNEEILAAKRSFTGLPIPAAAITLIATNLFLLSREGELFGWNYNYLERGQILFGVMLLLAYLMVSQLKFPSLKMLSFRIHSFSFLFFSVIFAVSLLYGVYFFLPEVIFLFSWSYLIISLVLTVARMFLGRDSQTLQDFEPEQDDV